MFSENYELPHTPVDLSVLIILEDAIRAAWQLLRDCPPSSLNLATALEENINFHLHEALEDRVLNRGIVDGFDENYFRAITSDPAVCNYNRKELKKRPDMLIKLVGRPENVKPSQDGIFIECKPIDAKHALTTQYCARGIARFVVGGYAWAMQEALMIGYTLQSQNAGQLLTTAFGNVQRLVCSLGNPSLCGVGGLTTVTKHNRRFSYSENGVIAPPILIRHVWLNRN